MVLGAPTSHVLELVRRSSWGSCPVVACDRAGTHEALGGVAIAVAVAMLARGEASEALFVGSARGWGYAGRLRPASGPPQ